MARVTTLIYKATGRRPRSTGSGTPTTPGTTTIAPPLLGDGNAVYAPEVVADGLIVAPFVDNSQSFYSPIVSAASVFVSPPKLANTQVFFPPTVNQTIYLPLHTNTQTFYDAQVLNAQAIVAPLLSDGDTFYGPTVNQSVTAPLLTNSSVLYAPTIVTGTSILPTLLDNSQSFYGPQLNLKVTPGLLSNSSTVYGPTVGQTIIAPATFASGNFFYPPQVNLSLRSGWVNNSNTFYGPIVSSNALIVAPFLNAGNTVYAPTLSRNVKPPLLTNSNTLYTPAVVLDTSQVVNAPYHLNSQTFYGPQLNRNVKPALFTNTSVVRAPTVSLASSPGYILSTPGLVLTSAAGAAPEVDLTLNSDHYAGYYIDIQRSTTGTKNVSDGSYVTQTMNIAHQIEPEELAALAITNADLINDGYTNPSGAWFQQYRIRREDGALSAWVEVSGTVTQSVAQLHTLAGFNRATSLTYPSTGHEFEVQNIEAGSLRKARATISATGKRQFEVTLNAWSPNASRVGIGIDDGSYDFTTGGSIPGNTGLPNGICFRADSGGTGTIYANGAVHQSSPANRDIVVGDVVSVVIDTTAATVKFYRTRSGSTVQIGANVPLGFGSTVYAFGGCERADNIEFNFGASAFTRSLDTGFAIYG